MTELEHILKWPIAISFILATLMWCVMFISVFHEAIRNCFPKKASDYERTAEIQDKQCAPGQPTTPIDPQDGDANEPGNCDSSQSCGC